MRSGRVRYLSGHWRCGCREVGHERKGLCSNAALGWRDFGAAARYQPSTCGKALPATCTLPGRESEAGAATSAASDRAPARRAPAAMVEQDEDARFV